MCLKMPSEKWRPFCLGPTVLVTRIALHPRNAVQNSPTPRHAVLLQELINAVCQLNGKVLARATVRIDGPGKARGNMKSFTYDLQRPNVIMQNGTVAIGLNDTSNGSIYPHDQLEN